MGRPKKYPDELIERAVRLALESGRPIAHIAADLGMHPETLRKRVRRAEADQGLRPELPTTHAVAPAARRRARPIRGDRRTGVWPRRTRGRRIEGPSRHPADPQQPVLQRRTRELEPLTT
jgi:transposase-like protein